MVEGLRRSSSPAARLRRFVSQLWCRGGQPAPAPQPHVLVRKVNLALWNELGEGFEPHEVPATVVQDRGELVAKENTLSFWRFDVNDPRWLDDAVLAVVGGWKRIDGVHLAWVPESVLADDVRLVPSEGDTCFVQLRPLHRDAAGLDGRRLALVAERVAAAARAGDNVVIKTREEVVDLLVEAVTKRRMMKVDNLPNAHKQEVKKRLGTSA